MSTGSFLLLCLLVLQQVCIAQLSLISSSQLTGGSQIGGGVLCQDPIWRARLMSRHARNEFDGCSADSISDEELTGDEYDSNNDGGLAVAAGGEASERFLLPPDGDDEGGSSGGTKDGDVRIQCPECGKLFKNDKSMFGHLRSHPNRGYKGATPPVKKMKLSPETAVGSSSSSVLADNSKAPQQVPPPPLSVELEAIGQGECGTRGLVTDSTTADQFKCIDNAGVETGNLINCDGHSDFIVKIPKKRRNMPKDIRDAHSRKKAKVVLTPKEKRPYACKHCKAEFPTNQALGGHVAGHHREKKVHRLNDPPAMAAESQNNGKQLVEGGGYDDDDYLSLQKGLHSEQFPVTFQPQSGMASEGQMRQHSERRNLGLSSAVESPTPARTDHGDARRLWDLNIDLNVEAPEQE